MGKPEVKKCPACSSTGEHEIGCEVFLKEFYAPRSKAQVISGDHRDFGNPTGREIEEALHPERGAYSETFKEFCRTFRVLPQNARVLEQENDFLFTSYQVTGNKKHFIYCRVPSEGMKFVEVKP